MIIRHSDLAPCALLLMNLNTSSSATTAIHTIATTEPSQGILCFTSDHASDLRDSIKNSTLTS